MELVDNGLDACEEAGAPVIEIAVSDDGIAVTDNGPGIAPETVASILDYTSRTSSREAYVSPTRGAQGNALKTILAMGFVLDDERGETIIESRGVAHRITFSIDPIRQEPRIVRVCEKASFVKTGTRNSVLWPISKRSASTCQVRTRRRCSGKFLLQTIRDRARWRPYLAEAAFGYCPKGTDERRIVTGVNWSVAIGGDPFRRLGDLGQSLDAILTKQRAGPSEQIITVLHLACPRVEYLDRGKSSVNLP